MAEIKGIAVSRITVPRVSHLRALQFGFRVYGLGFRVFSFLPSKDEARIAGLGFRV